MLAVQYLKRTTFAKLALKTCYVLGLLLDKGQVISMHIIENDFVADGSKYKSRVYCIGCSKFIEAEVRYDPRGEYPVVHHNNGHKHSVIFATDIQRLLQLGTSRIGQSTRYEIAQMCGISVEKLEQVLADIGKGV